MPLLHGVDFSTLWQELETLRTPLSYETDSWKPLQRSKALQLWWLPHDPEFRSVHLLDQGWVLCRQFLMLGARHRLQLVQVAGLAAESAQEPGLEGVESVDLGMGEGM